MYMTNTKFSPNFSSHLLNYGELPSAQEKKEKKDLMALETFHTDFGCVLMRMRPEERKLVTPEGLMKLSRERFPQFFGVYNGAIKNKKSLNNYSSYAKHLKNEVNFNKKKQYSTYACERFPKMLEKLYKDRKGDYLFRGVKDKNDTIKEEYKDTFYSSWTYSLREAEMYAGQKGSIIILPITENLRGINLYKKVYYLASKIAKINRNVFERGARKGSLLGTIWQEVFPTSYEIVLEPMELDLQGFLLKNAWILPKSQANIKYYMAFNKNH